MDTSDWLALGAIILSAISLIITFIYNKKALDIAELSAKASLIAAEAQEDAVKFEKDKYDIERFKK